MPPSSQADPDALAPFDPAVRRWFVDAVGAPTSVQAAAWRAIARREHVLAIAPTGSGKTLAAFLYALDRLLTGQWEPGATRVLYVSPLKALNNDIERNLVAPLASLRAAFAAAGRETPDIQVRTRSGDTEQAERQRMLRRPPEILITTPESLNLLLSSPRARGLFANLETVILDEIHAVASGKRGTHLITAVERLVDGAGEFQRVALSATVRPPESIGAFVGGLSQTGEGESARFTARPVTIVAEPAEKRIDVAIRYIAPSPADPPGETQWPRIAAAIKTEHISRNRSTLVFVNSRRVCERMALHLNRDEPDLVAYAHHGSLSKDIRRVVEERLKNGELPAIVATGSLELGIDIGAIDEAILVQTPGAVAAALQRIGRAGHQVGAVSRATVYPTHGRDILNAAVMCQAVADRDIEPIRIVECPLDVLAQVLVSMTGVQAWHVDELYNAVRRSWPYRDLSRRAFDLVLAMLAGRYADSRVRALQPLAAIDGLTGTVTGRPGGLPILYSSGGTIPDRGYFKLRHGETSAVIGELDEEFVWERRLGDRFLLGSQSWRIVRITHNDVFVQPVKSSPSDAPFWRAEELTRSAHLSDRLLAFLEEAEARRTQPGFRDWLAASAPLSPQSAAELASILTAQSAVTGAPLPHAGHILVERVYEAKLDPDRIRIILHTLWGGALNRPFAMMLAAAWEERFGERADCIADNDCVALTCPAGAEIGDLFALVPPARRDILLRNRLEQTGFFGARFRECAGIALLCPKSSIDRRMPLWMSRERAKKLLDAVIGYADFPILIETWRTCLQDEFDLDALYAKLDAVHSGRIRVSVADTEKPSPFAEGLGWQRINELMYKDDTPNSARPSALASSLIADVARNASLRPAIPRALVAAFEQKIQRLAPGYAPANAAELVEWMKERLLVSEAEWQALGAAIERDHGLTPESMFEDLRPRVGFLVGPNGARFAVAIECIPRITSTWGAFAVEALTEDGPVPAASRIEGASADPAQWLGEWLRSWGPMTFDALTTRLPFAPETLRSAVASLVDEETVIADTLTDGDAPGLCDAENVETLLRWLRTAARPAMATLPVESLAPFTAAWQGLGADAVGPDALPPALEPLLLCPMPAAFLETEILPARMRRHVPAAFDALLAESGLRWYGAGKETVVLAFPDQRELLPPPDPAEEASIAALFPDPNARYAYEDLLGKGMSSTELTGALWDLAWRGRAANDTWLAVRNGAARNFTPPEKAQAQGRRVSRGAFARWKSGQAFGGAWHALPPVEAPADELAAHERNRERVRILLARYGVLFRERLAGELPPFRWGALFRTLRIMELSGEVVAGAFFHGIPGLQFAAPDCLDALSGGFDEEHVYWMCAVDPASLCGIGLDALKGELPRRHLTTHLVYHGSRLVLVSEGGGKRIDIRVPHSDSNIGRYLDLFDVRLGRAVQPAARLYIETINGEPAGASPYLAAFRERFETAVSAKNVALYKRTI